MRRLRMRIVSILCCVAMLLALLPEKAKADPGTYVEDISSESFTWQGGRITAKAGVSNPDYDTTFATYNWIGGTSPDPATMTATYAGYQVSREFIPPAKM